MEFELKNLRIVRGRRGIIRDVSAGFDAGITAILGPNGAGKTTLLGVMAQLGRGARGSMHVSGRLMNSNSLRRREMASIGYMPQQWNYPPGFTAKETIEYAAWLKGMPQRALHGAARRALEEVDLSEAADRKVKTLSGGMQRRVGLAGAIVASPSIIILDEPMVGLDPEQRVEFRSALRRRADSAAVILSTHMIDEAQALAQRVMVLNHGEFVFDGTIQQMSSLVPQVDPVNAGNSIERGYLHALTAGVSK